MRDWRIQTPCPGDVQASFCATIVDEFTRFGVRHAVVCPGSRSTPLAIALADNRAITLHIRLDERSAAFFAMGIGLHSAMPAVICVSSGTAAAELHAAIVEADLARVPMLVCTADRPLELHTVGAPQTIDQQRIYGSSTRWFFDAGVPEWVTASSWRSLGARAVAEALANSDGPGPVHLNLPFRDPLLGDANAVPPGRAMGAPWHSMSVRTRGASFTDGHAPDEALLGRRGLLLVGAGGGSPDIVLEVADELGWPLLADPRSLCRVNHPRVIAAADGILRCAKASELLRPDVVVRMGGLWASKVLAAQLRAWSEDGCVQVLVDPWSRWLDPDRDASHVVVADPDAWCRSVVALSRSRKLSRTEDDWQARWSAAESAAQRAIESYMTWPDGAAGIPEPVLAHWSLKAVPSSTVVMVSSSMPVRDMEWFGPRLTQPPKVLSNRGANGIDGVVSTALGITASCSDADSDVTGVVALVGDLALLHDLTALVGVDKDDVPRIPLTLLVVDNQGGGIFSFLPQYLKVESSRFERLFGTPPEVDIASAVEGLGIPVQRVAAIDELREALAGPTTGASGPRVRVVLARSLDRTANTEFHKNLNSAIVGAVDDVLDHV